MIAGIRIDPSVAFWIVIELAAVVFTVFMCWALEGGLAKDPEPPARARKEIDAAAKVVELPKR